MSRKSKTPKAGVLRTLRARAQSVTMHVTEEDDWDTDVPNVRFSRIIAIVVLLHVIAVGGILTFNQIGKKDDRGEQRALAATPAAPRSGGLDRTSLTPEKPRAPKVGDAAVRGLQHYRVTSGDNAMSIARQFEVPVSELERINGLDSGTPLFPGLILYIPNKTITANTATEVQAIMDGQNRGRIQVNNQGGGAVVPVAMNPAVLEVEAPRALQVTEAPVPAPPARRQVQPVPPAPQRVAEPAPPAAPPQQRKVAAVIQSYTVQKGDTAYSLGRRFGISHQKLLQINGIADARTLRVGQSIRVPVKAQ